MNHLLPPFEEILHSVECVTIGVNEQQKDFLSSEFNLDTLAFEIINTIYGENIKDLREALGFCIDIENQFWKNEVKVKSLQRKKVFLTE